MAKGLALFATLSLPIPCACALDLVWDAPATCPDRDAILGRIQARSAAGSGNDWRVQARVTRSHVEYTLELTLYGPNADPARRTLRAGSCAALAEAAAVLITLALESPAATSIGAEAPAAVSGNGPIHEERTSPDTLAPAAGEPPQTAAPPRLRAPASTPRGRSHQRQAHGRAPGLELGFELGTSLALDAGMLTGAPRLGVRPDLALRLGRLRTALGATFWPSAESQASAYPRARLRDSALIADVAIGFDAIQTRFELRPSLAMELGQVRLITRDIAEPADTRVAWLAVGAGLQIAYRFIAGLHVNVNLFGFAPLAPPHFALQTPQGNVEVFVPSPIGLRASAGIAYVFQ